MDTERDVFRTLDELNEPARMTVEDVAALHYGDIVGSFGGMRIYNENRTGWTPVIHAALMRSETGMQNGWVQCRNYTFIRITSPHENCKTCELRYADAWLLGDGS